MDLGKGMSKSGSEVGVAVSEEGTDLRMSDFWLGANDLWKGMIETNSPTREVVSEEGTDLREPERMSSGKGLWRGLSKCSSSDLGKGMSETCATGEVGVDVSVEETDLSKSERMSTDLTMSERNSTDLRKSKRVSTDLSKYWSKRMCLGKGLWISGGKCNASYLLWKKGKEKRRKRKRVSKIPPCKSYLPSDIYYFPSTYVPINSKTLVNSPGPIEVTYLPTNEKFVKFVKGQKLEKDVVSLLSNDGKRDYLVRNNGDKVSVKDSVAGKHLLICCFKVPLPENCLDTCICRAMIAAYSRLRKNNVNFEMVMIAKMVDGDDGDDKETTFNQFFKAFPCLAFPFCDAESRNFLCRSLGLTSPFPYRAAAVLDPNQMVLQTDTQCFYRYGASGFPYSDAQLDAVRREDAKITSRLDFELNNGRLSAPVSLVDFLGSDVVLSRFGGDDKRYASEMSKKKCVVLYLCGTGMHMVWLKNIREKCAAGDLECEVVLVHIPFMWDTASFVNAVQLELERLKLSSWWVAPLIDEEAARRLGRLCSNGQDNFIILADGGNAVELEGIGFMDHLGSLPNKTYPFTRMTMAQDFFDRLRQVTLESLLLHPCRDKVGGSVSLSDLKGRKVLIYFDRCENVCKGEGRFYKKLLRCYDKIKEVHPALEVILAPLRCKCPGDNVVGVPWLVYPHASAIYNQVFLYGGCREDHALVAFREDGIIRSRKAQRRLKRGSLFKDTLFREIVHDLKTYLRHW